MFQSTKRFVATFYKHVTLNNTTLIFFVVALLHSLAQGVIQSLLFTIDHQYTGLLSTIISRTSPPHTNFTFLTNDRMNGDFTGFKLMMCNDIPSGASLDPCTVVFDDEERATMNSSGTQSLSYDSASSIEVRLVNSTDVGLFFPGEPIAVTTLNSQCIKVLDYPRQLMYNYRREDLTFIFVQFWLFGVSVSAVVFNSVPHTLTLLLARALITAWSAYAIWRTQHLEEVFRLLFINPDSPCHIDLWPGYGQARLSAEIPDLILNCTALLLSCALGYRLVKTYNQQSFMRMGPPPQIVRIYKYFMAVFVVLQLSTLFTTIAVGLWVDQLMNTAIGRTAEFLPLYKAGVLLGLLSLIPWITLGYYAVRKEHKKMMTAFLAIGLCVLIVWSTTFYSSLYRWTLKEWPFILGFTIYSFMLIIASIVLGTLCWFNFGKGLAQYLHAEAALAKSNFAPSVFRHDPEAASISSSSAHELGTDAEKIDRALADYPPSPIYDQNARYPSSKGQRDHDEGNPIPTFYLPTLTSCNPKD
ncbi:hypothetical protein HGRIS_006827 [Hohenbuehelia grisea]|uniref:Uncharacterized protein n=1 Tax=Hohenbuehelia grisea TaxID=104357 RepID=A0ABR3JBA8_9AGAR